MTEKEYDPIDYSPVSTEEELIDQPPMGRDPPEMEDVPPEYLNRFNKLNSKDARDPRDLYLNPEEEMPGEVKTPIMLIRTDRNVKIEPEMK